MDRLDMKSVNIVDKNIELIGQLFPNVIKEAENGLAIDFDMLKQELSNVVIDGNKERYQLTWPGKKEAIVNANTPTKNTLRPIKEKSVDFDITENIYIEGDNLEVLKILQESYLNKIKCIYIDPPYNTGNDFIYNDNFVKNSDNELLESGQKDEDGNRLVTNNQSNGRYHSDWISMMYSRLKLARNLLTDNGVLLVNIDDNEFDNLKKIVTEIFGENNSETIIWKKIDPKYDRNTNAKIVNTTKRIHEYIIVAFKTKEITKFDKIKKIPKWLNNYNNPDNDIRGNYKQGIISFHEGHEKENKNSENYYSVESPSGRIITRMFFVTKEEFDSYNRDNRIYWPNDGDGIPALKIFENEEKEFFFETILEGMGSMNFGKKELAELFCVDEDEVPFSTPKPTKLIKEIFRAITSKRSDLILDFFSGSATTAHAVMQLNAEDGGNRKYIMVQLPEETGESSEAYKAGYKNICEIGEERIRRAAKKIKEETNADIDYGFRVYKLDSSNMKDVYYAAGEYSQDQLDLFESNIKEDRTSEDLLTQVMLGLGLKLDLKIEEKELRNNKIYFVENNSLVACFDEDFNIDNIEDICKVKPLKLIFRDSSFNTDNDKINVSERIKKLSPETEISVI